MPELATAAVAEKTLADLRTEVSQVRRRLMEVTDAYRKAVTNRRNLDAIPLLRTRSQLMRELLESQCALLLRIRSDAQHAPMSDGHLTS